MQEQNNFERQVKETMDGFSVQPSAPVWQKIEREIRQKKERRRVVLWLLPLLLAGGLWLALSQRGEQQQEIAARSTQSPAPTDQNGPADPAKEPLTETEVLLHETEAEVPTSTTAPISRSNDLFRSGLSILKQNKPANSTERTPGTARKRDAMINEPLNRSVTVEIPMNEETTSSRKATTEVMTEKTEEADIKTGQTATDTPPATSDNKENKVDQNEAMDSAAVAPKTETIEPVSRPRKWKLILQATGGYAQTINSFFPLAAAAESNIVPNSLGFLPRESPRPSTPGAAFSIGSVLSTTVSTKLSFNTGVQYTYTSTKQPYGQMAYGRYNGFSPSSDSSAALLTTGISNQYTNQYHFLEIPAGISYSLFSTLPVDLHAGLSLTALASSNAVQYDEEHDIYYKQNDKLQRLGLNVFAGFSYSLAKERLKVGPHIQYGLIPVHTRGDKSFMLMGGLRAAYSLR